jgi:polyferredoxin
MTFRTAAVKRKRIRWIKFILWAIWLGLYAFLLFSSEGPLRADFFYQTENGFSVSSYESLILYLMIAGLLFFLPLVIGRRASCHIVCWMAPFMIAGRKLRNIVKWPALRLTADSEKCISCGRCSKECPMSIDVMKNALSGKMEDQDCILCGVCVDVCPKDVISFGFRSG